MNTNTTAGELETCPACEEPTTLPTCQHCAHEIEPAMTPAPAADPADQLAATLTEIRRLINRPEIIHAAADLANARHSDDTTAAELRLARRTVTILRDTLKNERAEAARQIDKLTTERDNARRNYTAVILDRDIATRHKLEREAAHAREIATLKAERDNARTERDEIGTAWTECLAELDARRQHDPAGTAWIRLSDGTYTRHTN